MAPPIFERVKTLLGLAFYIQPAPDVSMEQLALLQALRQPECRQ